MAQKSLPRVSFEKYTLANGLQVILHVDRKLPVVHVKSLVPRGVQGGAPRPHGVRPSLRAPDVRGVGKRARGILQVHRTGGRQPAGRAASTARRATIGPTTSPPCPRATWSTCSGWSRTGSPRWPARSRRRTSRTSARSVRNERRQTTENQPYGRWFELVNEHLYPSDHPYSWPIIGRHEDLEGRHGGRSGRVLPDLLHAQQPFAGHCRRLRRRPCPGPRGPLLRRTRSGPPDRPAAPLGAFPARKEDRGSHRLRPPGPGPHGLAGAGQVRCGRDRAGTRPRPYSGTACLPGWKNCWFTTGGCAPRSAPSTTPQEISRVVRGRRHRPPRLRRPGGRGPGHEGNRAVGGRRSDPGRGGTRPDRVGVPVRLEPRAYRRIRRQGRPAERVEYLPERPGVLPRRATTGSWN